jgi:signal transduction histidine kinase
MTNFENISSKALKIVRNFIETIRANNISNDAVRMLMVSLYNSMPFAEEKVSNLLMKYNVQLEEYLTTEEIQIIKEEYKAVITYCYKQIDPFYAGIANVDPDLLNLSPSLVELCMAIAEPQDGESVLLPYTGVASFLFGCENCSVEGFEDNDKAWAFSQIVASAINTQARIYKCPAAKILQTQGKKYDYIFTFLRIRSLNDIAEMSDVVYKLITDKLAEDGEFYAILPMSFCYSPRLWFDVRKILWDKPNQYSTLVISLPRMMQPVIGVSLCLVHFKKDNKGLVVLADVTSEEFFSRRDVAGYKEPILKINSILETIQQQDEKHVWVGSTNQLTEDVNLQPSRFLVSQFLPKLGKGERMMKISDLIEIVPCYKIRDGRIIGSSLSQGQTNAHTSVSLKKLEKMAEDGIPLIGMNELSSSYLNCEVNRKDIPVTHKLYYQLLTGNCLLVGFIGGKFKVAKLHGVSEETPVILHGDIVPFKIKSNDITEEYLLRELLSEKTETQGKMLASGNVMPRLKRQDLLLLQIVVPSLERQIDLCKEDTRATLTESDRKIIESYEEFRNDMHMKKHAIGQTIFNLNNWWKVLQRARKEGNGTVCDTALVGKTQPIAVSEIYDNIQEVLSKLQQQISKLDRGNGLQVKNFALTEFIESYISNPQNQSPLFKYIYDKAIHHADQTLLEYDQDDESGTFCATGKTILKEGDPLEFVDFAPDALKIIFDNIVSNATSHGFVDNGKPHFIKIELTSEGSDYIITISNNGLPLDNRLTIQDVFTYNKSSKNGKSHFGLGGYEVQKLMREFGGEAEFSSAPNSEFPVSYKLVFHNTNIIYSSEL